MEKLADKEELSEVLYMPFEKLKKLFDEGSDEIVFKKSVKAYEKVFKMLDELMK